MANKMITPQLLRVFEGLSETSWLTVSQIAEKAEVSSRCSRAHLVWLTENGLALLQEMSPSYWYRRNPKVPSISKELLTKLQAAKAALYGSAQK
jgi:predicted ArsR family transcriptional regulator